MKSNIKIKIDLELSDEVVLWRYMSLEKLINLIDTRALFLSPIAFFKNSDPLEGHLPKKFHDEIASHLQSMMQSGPEFPESAPKEIRNFEKELKESSSQQLKLMREKARGRKSICCWYESQFESEAMWKLYGDNGKSIAIKTTVGSLRKSIESRDNEKLVFLERIRYLDFNNVDMTRDELLAKKESVASILLKRKEYEHEREVRLYHEPDRFDLMRPENFLSDYWEKYIIKPHTINVDVSELIHSIVISPYVSEPYTSSVKAICGKYELTSCDVYQSKLLESYDIK
ncbi:DUF2971 domain-containing protein [Pseudomonas protegens]|uniref:DUF2971 domain-containing protein n=1 Tax=Pseudomonas TaxID=286 RepID=UPI001472D365|nr:MULTISPECIES: DUF2971 domain-containing protein [Pseudomonas]MDT9642572.1 DUF2971 domain-containing protein [Pseudomonas sp. JV245A]NMZ26069.1 DUF2971 domain-containing protein [Pseudomonas protegens]NMZ84610.1 DUF2971 domain-containing protein [Pseudomonas protegens]